MKTYFIISQCIGTYIGIAIIMYLILHKIKPYNPDEDSYGDGDTNKFQAILWPISLPMLIFCSIIKGISEMFDMIRDISSTEYTDQNKCNIDFDSNVNSAMINRPDSYLVAHYFSKCYDCVNNNVNVLFSDTFKIKEGNKICLSHKPINSVTIVKLNEMNEIIDTLEIKWK